MKPSQKKPVAAAATERLTEGLLTARKQLMQVEKDIASEAKKQRKSVEKLLARVRSRQDLKVLEKRISATASELQARVKAMPKDVLSALGVATADDVQKLSRSLSRLTKRVDELARRQASA